MEIELELFGALRDLEPNDRVHLTVNGPYEARHLRRSAMPLSDQLVDARPRSNLTTGRQRSTRQHVAGHRTVNVSFESLGVIQPANEQHIRAKVSQRREHLTEFHLVSLTLRPPLLAVESVAREQHRHANRSLAGRLRLRGVIAPNGQRLHPRQRHRHADAVQESSTRELIGRVIHRFVIRNLGTV